MPFDSLMTLRGFVDTAVQPMPTGREAMQRKGIREEAKLGLIMSEKVPAEELKAGEKEAGAGITERILPSPGRNWETISTERLEHGAALRIKVARDLKTEAEKAAWRQEKYAELREKIRSMKRIGGTA